MAYLHVCLSLFFATHTELCSWIVKQELTKNRNQKDERRNKWGWRRREENNLKHQNGTQECIRRITRKNSNWWTLKVLYWKNKDPGKKNLKKDFKARQIHNNFLNIKGNNLNAVMGLATGTGFINKPTDLWEECISFPGVSHCGIPLWAKETAIRLTFCHLTGQCWSQTWLF